MAIDIVRARMATNAQRCEPCGAAAAIWCRGGRAERLPGGLGGPGAQSPRRRRTSSDIDSLGSAVVSAKERPGRIAGGDMRTVLYDLSTALACAVMHAISVPRSHMHHVSVEYGVGATVRASEFRGLLLRAPGLRPHCVLLQPPHVASLELVSDTRRWVHCGPCACQPLCLLTRPVSQTFVLRAAAGRIEVAGNAQEPRLGEERKKPGRHGGKVLPQWAREPPRQSRRAQGVDHWCGAPVPSIIRLEAHGWHDAACGGPRWRPPLYSGSQAPGQRQQLQCHQGASLCERRTSIGVGRGAVRS